MRFLVTGHTGFKGAWLSLLLAGRGHEVVGLSLDPVPGALYERARVGELLAQDLRVDIRDAAAVTTAVAGARADVVLHLAAQPLVRESYRDQRFTYETNVLGTFNILEAVSAAATARAQVVVTTDKVYRNVDQIWGYREHDALGGVDPYSASKAAADVLTQSWIATHPDDPATGIARAGNVVGGGDVSADRLMVDLLAAYQAGTAPVLRFPGAVRPWQHVLDCLNGYLTLVDALLDGRAAGEAYNFGPGTASFVDVGSVATRVAALWGDGAQWRTDGGEHPHEANLLALDARKAELQLGWQNVLGFDDTLAWTVSWARRVAQGEDARDVSLEQVAAFDELAKGIS